eukprot:1382926-Prymnesium_polylepis.1
MLEPRGMIRGAAPRFKPSTLIPPVASFICLRIEDFWFKGKCWSQELKPVECHCPPDKLED